MFISSVLTGWTGLPAGTWRYVDVNGDALTAVKGGNTGTFGVQSGIDTANGTVATADRKIELYKKKGIVSKEEAGSYLGWVVWEAYGEKHCTPVGNGAAEIAAIAPTLSAPLSAASVRRVLASAAAPKKPEAPRVGWESGYYTGLFADGFGTLDLLVDVYEGGVADVYLAVMDADGFWDGECEAMVAGDCLLLLFDAGEVAVYIDEKATGASGALLRKASQLNRDGTFSAPATETTFKVRLDGLENIR